MNRKASLGVLVATLLAVSAVPAAELLPVAGYDAAKEIPGAQELPDPSLEYKVLYMVGEGPKPDEVNPTLESAARYLNTLAKWGVPAGKRKFVVMIRGGMDMILRHEAYRTRHGGKDNPNLAILQALAKAGVSVRVCGQGVVARKYDAADILPEVQVDLWAMSTMVNLSLKGYVRIG